MSHELERKLRQIREGIVRTGSAAVAFSAGVDSSLLLRIAAEVLGPGNVVAVTADSPSLPRKELELARDLAADMGVEHVLLDTGELDDENYAANPANRCYFCKKTLYRDMADFAARRGLDALLCGTNADDLGDFRPGLDAAKELHVRAPLAEAGLTKEDVRLLSERFGLPTSDKPAAPCLSSRIPYGERVTRAKLAMIEAAESCLHEMGFPECRVRHHDKLARIEIPPGGIDRFLQPEVRDAVTRRLREIGYLHVALDLAGFRSGSLNEGLRINVSGRSASAS